MLRTIHTLTAVLLLAVAAAKAWPADTAQLTGWLQQQPQAREFPEGLDWLNTGGREVTLKQLRGRMVLLDFWTYGCINCLHIISAIKALEEKYGDDLVVIGVHSAKFAQEGQTGNIRNLVLRHGLQHPVVNDREFGIWNRYRARAWPTLVLIGPDGRVAGRWVGENDMQAIDALAAQVQALITPQHRQTRAALEWPLETQAMTEHVLKFPGKVLADGAGGRLFIADTGHNRIIIAGLDGKVSAIIGGKQRGWQDGDYQQARFAFPRGMALSDDDQLYVADTENHVVRRIDLQRRQVSTVAGTGQQVYQMQDGGPALETGINSPWDLVWVRGQLFIAMAGQHQIWTYTPQNRQLQAGELQVFAGNRQEALRDGPRLQAGLNQPSGLTSDGQYLYIADSEASAIRRVALPGMHQQGEQRLETLVGAGLFEFGDVDGRGRQVRLQHPLGVGLWRVFNQPDRIVIADSYNNKIKLLDPNSREVISLTGADQPLHEPGGVSVLGNQAFVADTNRHVIQVLDLQQHRLRTLDLVAGGERL